MFTKGCATYFHVILILHTLLFKRSRITFMFLFAINLCFLFKHSISMIYLRQAQPAVSHQDTRYLMKPHTVLCCMLWRIWHCECLLKACNSFRDGKAREKMREKLKGTFSAWNGKRKMWKRRWTYRKAFIL